MKRARTTKARKTSRLGRRSLPVIAALFMASAGLRMTEGAWTAWAKTLGSSEQAASGDCMSDESITALLQDLRAGEDRLNQRESRLAERAKAIQVAELRLEERIETLRSAEEDLARTLSIADKGAEEDVARLVALYENMKPKEAAPLFAEMAPDFAAGFIAQMRPDAAAALMGSLEPKTAYSISVLLAGRNANAPRN